MPTITDGSSVDVEIEAAIVDVPYDVDSAILKAVDAVTQLGRSATHATAHDACFELREATQRFFLAFGDFQEKTSTETARLQQALSDAERILADAVQKELSEDSFAKKYLSSVAWRRELVAALVAGESHRVKELVTLNSDS